LSSTNHGVVAVVAVPGVHLSLFDAVINPTLYDLLCTRIMSGKSTCIIFVIYRPGSASVSSAFFDDLSYTLDCVVGYTEPIFIVRDLNMRLYRLYDCDSQTLAGLFDSYGFVNCVTESSHVAGSLLDVVASYRDLPSPLVIFYDPGLSDHCLLPVSRPNTPIISVVRRPWHHLDVITLSDALWQSQLCRPECCQ